MVNFWGFLVSKKSGNSSRHSKVRPEDSRTNDKSIKAARQKYKKTPEKFENLSGVY
jgi:hypothetical protein